MKNFERLFQVILLSFILVFSGCRQNSSSGDSELQKIKIGAILPLTGELSYYGNQEKNALLLFEENNEDVKFIFEDSKGTPKDGLTAARRLINKDVKYCISSFSYVINTIQPVFDENEILNFTLNMDPRTEEQSEYCSRLYVTFYDEMNKLLQLVSDSAYQKVAVLYVNVETMNNAVDSYLRDALDQNGITLISETYEMSTKDFKPILARLQESNPDIIRIMDFGTSLIEITNTIQELAYFQNTTIISGLETLAIDYTKIPDGVKNRFYFTAPKLLLDSTNEITKKYTEKFDQTPIFDAVFCYDIPNLIVPVIREQGYSNVKGVISALSQMKVYSGIAAEYTINANGGVTPDIYWASIKDNKVYFVE